MPNITQIPALRVPLIDQTTGLMSREWYRFFVNIFQLTGEGSNTESLSDLQVGPPPIDFAAISSVAGSNTQVQFNNLGAFGASSNFTYDTGTNTVSFGNITGSALGMTIQARAPTSLETPGEVLIQGQNAIKANTDGGSVRLKGGAKTGFGQPGKAELESQDGEYIVRASNAGIELFGEYSSSFSFANGVFNAVGAQTAPLTDAPNVFVAGLNSTSTGNVSFQFLTDSQAVFEFGEPVFGTQVLAFYGATPVAQAAAYTKTYATASRTIPNATFTNLSTTAATNVAPYGFATQAQADDIATKTNNLAADVLILKQLIVSLVDDSSTTLGVGLNAT